MATRTNLPSWEQVDKLSDLKRLELVLDALPDGDIIHTLSVCVKTAVTNSRVFQHQGYGRNSSASVRVLANLPESGLRRPTVQKPSCRRGLSAGSMDCPTSGNWVTAA